MQGNKLLKSDVNLKEIAHLTPNFSGAEITGLIKSAASFSFNRHVQVGTLATVNSNVADLQVSKEDFMNALNEVHAAYGVSSADLELILENGFIEYNANVSNTLADSRLLLQQVEHNEGSHLISVLYHGPPSTGKSSLAAHVALGSGFPYVKLIHPDAFIGMNEVAKSLAIHKIFSDAYKSPLSLIILDDLETLVDFAPIGPRYSNTVLQTLTILLKKRPPKVALSPCASACMVYCR